jgi:hypothetical protein
MSRELLLQPPHAAEMVHGLKFTGGGRFSVLGFQLRAEVLTGCELDTQLTGKR